LGVHENVGLLAPIRDYIDTLAHHCAQRDAGEMPALKAGCAGLKLVTQLPENLPQVVADKRVVSQILLNLLSNAIKFTHLGETAVKRSA
jgi:signal transduction histidine kinase